MKTHVTFLLVLVLLGISAGAYAQFGTVVVFAPKGEKFTLYVGNKAHNSEPAARVEADNPGGPSYKLKVVFSDPSIKEISKLVFNKPHGTMFFKVGKNPKGAYVLESTSSEWMDNVTSSQKDNTPPLAETSADKKETKKAEPAKNESANSTKSNGCNNPMSEPDFNAQLIGISARPFEPMQLSAAKKLAETNCLLVSQIIRVIYVFNMESSRLSFAKFAYEHSSDRDNYSEVKNALHAEKSKTELDRYVAEKTK